jgi:radical SAM protein with 4Fe4S-binding SPASM domain
VWINTHGGHLTEQMAEGFIRAGLDCLTVSFDGLGEMYESIRIPLKYEESLERLRMMMAIRRRLKAAKPLIKVQTLWSAIKDDPEEYLRVMKPLVDKVSYNIDFDFKEIHFVPQPDYVCYRLWQRLAITSLGDILKCPSDFEKDEVLANVRDRSIKEVWNAEQEAERQRHLAGNRLVSIACRKCHHGATVVHGSKEYAERRQAVNEIMYEGGFAGVGLNREPTSAKRRAEAAEQTAGVE